jgi:FkbM family methyltransferase
MISIPENISRSFVYVDCGARGEVYHPFLSAYPQAQYIGFEADAEESARVQAKLKSGRRIFPVAVGSTNATLPFYVTKNPACSSFIEPNQTFFAQFLDSADDTQVMSVIDLPVVTLDDYLPNAGIDSIDFIELDTQGSELDILKGAQGFLKKSVLGLRIEVEFSPIYKDQPLFADVDSFVRSNGFVLFDLSRHHYRRGAAPRDLPTSGQLLYGHAFYLKDYRLLTGPDAWIQTMKLIMISNFFGAHDYAFEMTSYLMSQPQQPESTALANILDEYEHAARRKTRMFPLIQFVNRIGLQKLLESVVRMSAKFASAYQLETTTSRKSWAD